MCCRGSTGWELVSAVRVKLVELTSPMPPRIIRSPPAKKYHPMLAEPLPPAPRHPINVQLRGVSESRNPTRALLTSATASTTRPCDLQRSRVTKRLSELALDLVLGRQVELLKQLRRNGNAAGRPDVAQSEVLVHVVTQVLVSVRRAAIPIA